MANNIFGRYLEAEVLGADPIKLVHLLYRGAGDAVAAARRNLASGDIQERSRQITRAWEIVHELSRSLDRSLERGQGGEICGNLVELYAYMQQRLLQANVEQSDAPLAEVEMLLTTLAEAWRDIIPAKAEARPAYAMAESDYVPVSCSL